MLDEVRGPAERDDHAGEVLGPGAGGQGAVDPGGVQAAERHQRARQLQRDGAQARLDVVPAQHGERLADLDRVARGAPEDLVHVGDVRLAAQAGPLGDLDERVGKRPRVAQEGARAGLHVHHEALEAGGELLGEDGGDDERQALDGGRRVAQGVQAPVGGRHLARLPDDRAARLGDGAPQVGLAGRRVVAGDRLELVQRAARVAEAAAADHRHGAAAGRDQGREHERHLVPHPARRVLVEHRRVRARPVQDAAGVAHREGQRDGLLAGEAALEHRHRPGGDLAVGPAAVGDPVDELADLPGAQRLPVAGAADELLGDRHQAASSASSSDEAPMRNVRGVAQSGPRSSSAIAR